MSSALERVAEMARQAEAKGRAQKLGAETQQAAEKLRAAEARIAAVDRRVREERPARSKELAQADADEQALAEHTKKIAMYKSHLESDDFEVTSQIIDEARREIRDKRERAKSALEEIDRELKEAQQDLKAALARYTQSRRELDRLQPALAPTFAGDDRLARAAESHFPEVQIQAFSREVDDGAAHFGMLDRKEQYAQMMIWIGRLRRFQAGELSDDDRELSEQIFRRLVGISKQYEPGYIEAFQVNYRADWDVYVANAQEQLRVATDSARKAKEVESHRQERQAREVEQKQVARASAQVSMDDLKAIILRHHLPEEGVEEFQATLARVVSGYGTSDPQLLDLVRPFRDLLTGGEFRALRRNLERVDQDEAKDHEAEALREQYRDLLTATRGLRALMIGGSVREDNRRSLQRTFEFDELDWEVNEGTRPAMLRSLEERVKNKGVDLVLILKEFVGHVVPERLRPLCEQNGIPCLMVEKGYGASQLGETLRRGLVKSA